MRNTFTNFLLSLPRTEVSENRQPLCNRASKLSHLSSKLYSIGVLSFLLIMIVVSSTFAQLPANMVTGTYTLTTAGTVANWYDPGGSGGGYPCPSVNAANYSNNLNITETVMANPGQQIVVTWVSNTFGLASGDVLTVYDGPNGTGSTLATYTSATGPTPFPAFKVSSSNSISFVFTSDGSNVCRGWQAIVAAYYFMQPGNFSFSCPGTYTFVDPQNVGSGTPGGDWPCVAVGGNNKDYRDLVLGAVETFSTSNGQCIQVDPTYPSSFGICQYDTLTVYDGPSIFSPIANSGAAVYTNTNAASAFSTLGSNVTYRFYSGDSSHARGWQISMSCVACPSASINDNCASAILLSPASSCAYTSGSVSSGNSVQAGVPACVGNPNDDVWYSFVANNSTMSITVAATDGTMDPVVQLLSGACISFTSLYCANATGAGGTEIINATTLVPGTTYYVRVYDYTANAANHTFNICVVGSAPTDCVGAIHICSSSNYNGTFSWNSIGTQEYTSGTFGCILAGESTSQWLYFQCETSGTLGFNLASSNGTFQDIDWALWQETSGSMTCPMSAQPIRCSYAQGFPTNSYGMPAYSTGLQAAETDVSECAGTCGGTANAFVDTVHMVAGRYYILMLNLWNGNLNYQLSFQLSNGGTLDDCVLPIELLSFDGKNIGEVNNLYWTTESELNCDHFILERSSDGVTFSDLGTIKASGNSSSELNYDYYDQHPLNGINYYRLREVDGNGSYTTSQIISLEKSMSDEAIPAIYPNPTTGTFNVSLTSVENCRVEIEVFNQVGQIIQTVQEEMHPGENSFPVDLRIFERGIYTVKIRACDIGKVFTQKIVKI